MSENRLSVTYRGSNIRETGMDARQVSDAIRGFSEFSSRVVRELHGDNAKQRSSISSIRPGSIEIDFVHWVSDEAVQLGVAAMLDAGSQIPQVMGWCFDLIKHLKGEEAKSVNYEGDRGCQVENNYGEINNFHISAVNIVLDPKTGNALKKFGKKPLEGDAEEFVVTSGTHTIAEATSDEADYFVSVGSEDALIDQVVVMPLSIATTVFEGTGQWKFFDGARTFPATIYDEEFLEKIEVGQERFGKGDILTVRLRTVQKMARDGLKAEYEIQKVLNHETPKEVQQRLFEK